MVWDASKRDFYFNGRKNLSNRHKAWAYAKNNTVPPYSSENAGTTLTENLLAEWLFNTDSTTIQDVAGGTPAVDLGVITAVEWVEDEGRLCLSTSAAPGKLVGRAQPIIDAVKLSGAISIECWMKPLNVTQDGPARIFSIAGTNSSVERNIMLGQGSWGSLNDAVLRARVRVGSDLDGYPPALTPNDTISADTLYHVVVTCEADATTTYKRIYIDGVLAAEETALLEPGMTASNLFSSTWADGYQLTLCDEYNVSRPWRGNLYRMRVFSEALDQTKINVLYTLGHEAVVSTNLDVTFSLATPFSASAYEPENLVVKLNANSLTQGDYSISYDSSSTDASYKIVYTATNQESLDGTNGTIKLNSTYGAGTFTISNTNDAAVSSNQTYTIWVSGALDATGGTQTIASALSSITVSSINIDRRAGASFSSSAVSVTPEDQMASVVVPFSLDKVVRGTTIDFELSSNSNFNLSGGYTATLAYPNLTSSITVYTPTGTASGNEFVLSMSSFGSQASAGDYSSVTYTFAAFAPGEVSYGTGSIPTETGTGLRANCMFSQFENQDLTHGSIISVYAEHNSVDGIKEVQLVANGGQGAVATVCTKNTDPSTIAYNFTLNASSFPADGMYTFYAKAIPWSGKARVISRNFYVFRGPITYVDTLWVAPTAQGTGDGSTSGNAATLLNGLNNLNGGNSSNGCRLYFLPGSYQFPLSNCYTSFSGRHVRLEAGPGYDNTDITVTSLQNPGKFISQYANRIWVKGMKIKWTGSAGVGYSGREAVFEECDFTHENMGQINEPQGQFPYGGENGYPEEPGWIPFFWQNFGLNPQIYNCTWHHTAHGPINCDTIQHCTIHNTAEDTFRYPSLVAHTYCYDADFATGYPDKTLFANQAYGGTLWVKVYVNGVWTGGYALGGLHGDLFQWSFNDTAPIPIIEHFMGWFVTTKNCGQQLFYFNGDKPQTHKNLSLTNCQFSQIQSNAPFNDGYKGPSVRYNENHFYRYVSWTNQGHTRESELLQDVNYYSCYLASMGSNLGAASNQYNCWFGSTAFGAYLGGTNPGLGSATFSADNVLTSNTLNSHAPMTTGMPYDVLGNLRNDGTGYTAPGAHRGTNETN